MDDKELAESLQNIEREILKLKPDNEQLQKIAARLQEDEVAVRRGLLWLENKKLATTKEKATDVLILGENGVEYRRQLLPEQRIINALSVGRKTTDELKSDGKMQDEEVNVSIGALKSKGAITVRKESGRLFLELTNEGRKWASGKNLPEQDFLNRQFPVNAGALSEDEKSIAEELKKRKGIIKQVEKKELTVKLTEKGAAIAKALRTSTEEYIDRLSPEIIKSGKWKNAKLRRYDIKTFVPKIIFGKKQPYRRFLEDVRERFLSLGFEEMTGPIVESEFWDLDALFMPQFHSARDIHDAYYIKEPNHAADLPKELVRKVKEAHEKGIEESKGWRYEFSEEKTSRLIMRTQTTACSARKLASANLKIPGKYFAIGRCFRYDVIDAKHLADFNQVEGIVVEEGLNLRHLIGLLKLFAREFCGTDDVRVVPGYFPFTEPSAALYAKHPQLGWIELGGAGIFRPELVKPLVGRFVPVLAWGIGIDRIAMFKLGVNDIRELFSHNLEFLRNAKVL